MARGRVQRFVEKQSATMASSLRIGNDDAGGENDDGDGICVVFPKDNHAAEDGIFLAAPEPVGAHDREQICRDVENRRCER